MRPDPFPDDPAHLDEATLRHYERQGSAFEGRYRGLLEAAPDAILIVDAHGRLVLANARTETLFGYSRSELVGRPIELLVPEAQRAAHAALRDRYTQHPTLRPMGLGRELAARRKDGSVFPVEISLAPMEAEGRLWVSAAIRDVTERRRMEELRRRAQALEEEHRRTVEASRLKSTFLAAVSHELRTPLNSIVGFTQLLHDGKVGAVTTEQREFLGHVLTSASHLLHLINGLLDLGRIEMGRLDLRPEPIDPGQVAAEVTEGLRPLALDQQIELVLEAAEPIAGVIVDPVRLKQVLYNFVSNALKFSEAGGRVVVRALPAGETEFRLEVEDRGIGIRAEDLPRLFEEFQQLHGDAARRHAGTGLGLVLTKRLVEAQGGRVAVRSDPGRGSVFSATLPRVAPPARQEGAA